MKVTAVAAGGGTSGEKTAGLDDTSSEMRWDGEVDVLQVVGKKPGKTRATVVLEPRRREAVPKCTESRGPGFSCQTPKAVGALSMAAGVQRGSQVGFV